MFESEQLPAPQDKDELAVITIKQPALQPPFVSITNRLCWGSDVRKQIMRQNTGECPWAKTCCRAFTVCGRKCNRNWVGWKTSNKHSRAKAHPTPRKPHAYHFPIRVLKYALCFKKNSQSKSSQFLTPSNYISRKCLSTGSSYPSQNFSHMPTCMCTLLLCLVLTKVG